jgi:hypothetical protein
MSCGLPGNILTDRITIRKPVQSFVPGTKRPVFEFQVLATGINARFAPQSTALNRNVFGQTPNRIEVLFLNLTEISENYEVVNETTGKEYIVEEVKNFYRHHLEARVVEKK